MTPFALHIYGNTEVRSVRDRLAAGESAAAVLIDFNRHPTAVLVNYITHCGKTLAERVEILNLCEGL